MDLVQDMYEKEVTILVFYLTIQKKIKKNGFEGSIRLIAEEVKPHKRLETIGRMLIELGSESLFDQIN